MNSDRHRHAPPLLVLEWNTGGHHETYLKLYVAALLASGRKLVVLCRNPQLLLAELPASTQWVAAAIPGPSWLDGARKWPRFLRPRAYAWEISRILRQAERRLGGICGAVFHSCLYEHQARMIEAVVKHLGRPWSGLYLQARGFHAAEPDKGFDRFVGLFKDRRLTELLMVDEGAAPRVAAAIGRPVRLAPDLTDSTCAAEGAAAAVRAHAGSKPLVALMGHLLPTKGTATLAALALASEARDLALLFAGEIYWDMYSSMDRLLLETAMTSAPQAMFLDARIADEASYNALVASCDVLFAAYHDFPHSSNTLTKAALFEKPLIVSEGGLMAARVREFRMGEVVPAGDVPATLAAIRRVVTDPVAWRDAMRPRWQEYRDRHSFDVLLQVLDGLAAG